MARPGSLLLLALCCAACGSKGAVSLTARAEAPMLTVEQGALGSSLSGGFELVLELGEYAEDDVEVNLAGFGLHRDSEEIVGALSLSSSLDFPLLLGAGDSRRAAISIDMDTETLEGSVGDALCAGPVTYQGGVTDQGGKLTPAFSAAFSPSCQ